MKPQVAALAALLSVSTPLLLAQTQKAIPPYLNPKLPVERRVDDLLSRMTLEEKVAQLECNLRMPKQGSIVGKSGLGGVGPVLRSLTAADAARRANEIERFAVDSTRLHIPVIIHDEALHGLVANKATSFPQAIGLAATWDPALLHDIAAVIARETRSRGIRQVLSPVVNIARDVRWGRVEETYGEDPYLSSEMGIAFCSTLENAGVITTPKHFVANVGDGGRDSYPISFSERELREIYFPPFKACFQEGHATSVMAAYNSLDGLPCSSDPWLLTDVLRKEWGFRGFVVSDYGSVWGIKYAHHVAATDTEGAALAVNAGLDMELPNIDFYGKPLITAVREKKASMKALDAAVRNILRAKFRLGLFENPYADPEEAANVNDTPGHRDLARRAAREAIVLLKNDDGMLPLTGPVRSIAVIGPRADDGELGDYSGYGMNVVTVLQGIRNAVGHTATVRYAKGCELGYSSLPPIKSEYLVPPDAKPGEHGLKGEYFNNQDLAGTPVLTRIDKQVSFEWAMGSPDPSLPSDHFSVRWTGKLVPAVSGKYKLGVATDDGVRLYLDGKLLINSWYVRGATLDVATVTLEAGHPYDLRIEYFENDGWAYASLDWNVEQGVNPLIQAAADTARASDVAIVAVGIIEGEGYDRANLDLPGQQEDLISAVVSTGKPTIVVVLAGSAVTMGAWKDGVKAIVDAWYPGEEGGNAIADVLFGGYNPAGRLPITFPQFVGQLPLYYDHKPTGRGNDYADMSGLPLFPFGYGLSFTRFEYSNLTITPGTVTPGGAVHVGVDIRNAGTRSGDEVVQLYIHRPVASVTRPVEELKGFRRVHLEAGQTQTVQFELTAAQLSYLNRNLKTVLEPGTTEILVGGSSQDIRLRGKVETR